VEEGKRRRPSRRDLLVVDHEPRLDPTATTTATMEFSLQEELASLANADYEFAHELDIANMEPSEVNATLNGQSTLPAPRDHD
jgi:hypothetical protein